ncbi:MAG: glycosyltransferase family 2 protein, partial [Clostridia bacterium]|nr:glycosyltransferase family 2 protein [Clostridia bacterium]
MKTFMAKDHTFVVCAYKESPYLRECLDSLFAQTVKTNVIMATSTPNDYIRSIAVAYHVPLYFNDGVKSIADDWNFGIAQAKTELVTIAHQDDVYLPEYAESMIDMMNCFQRPLIAFSDYGEIRGTEHVYSNPLLKIKKIMLKPLRSKQLMKSRLVRRRILSLGSPICCPSVTFVRTNLTVPIFKRGFRSNV